MNKPSKTEKILSVIIIFLLIFILCGTIFALIAKNKKNDGKNQKELISQGKAVSLAAPKNTDKISYFDLGFIRIPTKPEPKNDFYRNENPNENRGVQNEKDFGAVLLARPWLSYAADDAVFFEELSRKKTIICGVFFNYFSQFSKKELLAQTETAVEENLKNEANSHFSLGKIEEIYFTDYIFFE